jgi:hypothetical protein
LYSVVWHILLVIAVLGGELFSHSCNRRHLSCFVVTRGFEVNGRNFWGSMGATQPIGIFPPHLSLKSTQLCVFAIFSNLFVMVQAMDLLSSSNLPPQSLSSLFGRVVCRHQMCRVKIRVKGLYLTLFWSNAVF